MSFSSLTQYTQPGSKIQLGDVNLGGVTVEFPHNNYYRYIVRDAVSSYDKPFLPFPYDIVQMGGSDCLVLPFYQIPDMFHNTVSTETVRDVLFKSARRKLTMGFGGAKMPNLVGKTHFIKSISIAAYDYHESLPQFRHPAMASLLGGQASNAIINNHFHTGVSGLAIHAKNFQYPSDPEGIYDYAWKNGYPRSSRYTTAHFPIYQPIHSNHARAEEIRAGDLLGQTAPRSSIRRGLMPTDWSPNYFYMAIYAKGADPDGVGVTPLWDTVKHGNIKYNQEYYSNVEHINREQDIHYPVPSITSDIDMEWDGNEVDIYVTGPGWFHSISQQTENEYKFEQDELTSKGMQSSMFNYITFMHCPVEIMFDVMIKD